MPHEPVRSWEETLRAIAREWAPLPKKPGRDEVCFTCLRPLWRGCEHWPAKKEANDGR